MEQTDKRAVHWRPKRVKVIHMEPTSIAGEESVQHLPEMAAQELRFNICSAARGQRGKLSLTRKVKYKLLLSVDLGSD